MTVIGIIAGQKRQQTVLYRAYTDALLRAGGTPVIIPAAPYDERCLNEALGRIDVLLLAGGGDVDPPRYGRSPVTTLDNVDTERDATELAAIRWAMENQRRVLGICRGAQMLAVATGGTLVQDLPAVGSIQHFDANHDCGYAALHHVVEVKPGTLTERVLDGLTNVNSHHHQAVESPGDVFVATAWTSDGVIEAIEGSNVLGVQWHPEFMSSHDGKHARVFQWLVAGEEGL